MAAEQSIVAPEAEHDIAGAYGWYASQRVGLGEEFPKLCRCLHSNDLRNPELHRVVHEKYRRGLVRRFPYAVFYEYADDVVVV